MNSFDIQSFIITIDELVFSHTGEHLDDLQHEILEGVVNHQKYAEIAQKNHLSQKYIKETAGKLWKTLSEILGEEVSKANIKSSLQRYYHSNFSNVINSIQINKGNICTGLSEKELKQSNIYQQAKLETIPELIKEGLTVEQIARALKLPLDLVRSQLEEFE
ncbi:MULTISPECIES: ATPase [unclassified Microcystis]|jgi:DNA-binding CsgD family transcriptional regulator|uniref:ATPase n=1 Tax=unclassified Microcystis TaxID=2643300 RepID=UPI00119742C5|nr:MULTISPECIES: ATPase [unclassified Microcystis]MCA2928112.1 ATPase [Microcystis sp. M020S1]MCA2937107.1 ATPase [Microcystis sp. M015S1]NCS51014.1 ATPase [Microcystis aeruginosa G13-05]MCA2621294.1 ATPase [Microcystis sp. M099S2]MCA2650737.1 ATPase [Microcystis sp. M065S2]